MFTIYNESAKPRSSENNVDHRQPSPKRCMKIEVERFRDHWTDFCNVTSVHGARYLVAYDRPFFERLWWASVLATSLYYASAYASELCSRWLNSPIEHSSMIKYDSILNIPLPAITFCNNMKATADKKNINALAFLCGVEENGDKNNSVIDIEELIEMSPAFHTTCQMLHEHSPEVNNSISNCEKMFTRVITQNGICYTINMLDAKEVFREGVISHFASHNRSSDWHPDTGYKKDAKLADRNGTSDPFFEGPYPKRAISLPMINISFRSLLNGSKCQTDTPGVKVAVHNPHEIPIMGHRAVGWILVNDEDQKSGCFNCLRSDFEYLIEIDPEYTWASSSLRIFQPHQRKCYYNGERQLTYFKFYTKANCENECLINHTLKKCNCVDFYMPHFELTNICELEKVECIIDAMDWWERRGKKDCSCYPSCTDMNYKTYIWGKNKSSQLKRENLNVIVYMADDYYISKENKQSQWTIVDLIASCGGVFGLFCGMSLIGVVEFLYYGTIRVVSNTWRRHKRKSQLEVEDQLNEESKNSNRSAEDHI